MSWEPENKGQKVETKKKTGSKVEQKIRHFNSKREQWIPVKNLDKMGGRE